MSYALDLQQMQQNPGEKVRAFATRFNQVAAYLSSDQELEVLSFRNKLLPEYRERVDIAAPENMEKAVRVATRAEEFMETDRRQQEALEEVHRVITKTPGPTPATQRAPAPACAPRPPQMNARYTNGTYNTGNNYQQGFNQNNFATHNTNRGSWQSNRDTTAAAPPQRNISGPPAGRPGWHPGPAYSKSFAAPRCVLPDVRAARTQQFELHLCPAPGHGRDGGQRHRVCSRC